MNYITYCKLVLAMIKSVLYPEQCILLISPKYEFSFKGGKCKVCERNKKDESDVIRGKRSKVPIHYFDYETCDISKEKLEKILKPYLNIK